jgi:hypothetical protein
LRHFKPVVLAFEAVTLDDGWFLGENTVYTYQINDYSNPLCIYLLLKQSFSKPVTILVQWLRTCFYKFIKIMRGKNCTLLLTWLIYFVQILIVTHFSWACYWLVNIIFCLASDCILTSSGQFSQTKQSLFLLLNVALLAEKQ